MTCRDPRGPDAVEAAGSLGPMSSDILPEAHPFSFTGGSDGVLVLHGYTSNPASMRPMAERLASAGLHAWSCPACRATARRSRT